MVPAYLASGTADSSLGAFLRSRRERLDPAALGLSTLRRRRTPGLRREEVADAAGISVEWYVKLEQGRAIAPPARTIDALARALKLDATDHAHLRRLAGNAPGIRFEREHVPPSLRRMVERMPFPAYLTGRRWDVLAWNAAAADLLGDFGAMPVEDRNILLFALTDPAAKALFGSGWSKEAKRMVALFRSTFDLFAHDPAFTALVARVRRGCAGFEGWWADHDIRTPSSGTKTLHTAGGSCRYDYTSFQANDDPALKLAIYMPA
jgi:transcriptional regulator with XRE-family HTH domain